MIYSIQVTVAASRESTVAVHSPVLVETLTKTRGDIAQDEIDAVAECFKKQLRSIIYYMAKE